MGDSVSVLVTVLPGICGTEACGTGHFDSFDIWTPSFRLLES
jgi:hypothetical protein